MAKNNSGTRADKAASDTKKTGKSGAKSNSKKTVTRNPKVSNRDFLSIFPTNLIIAVISLALFVLFLVTAINPDAVLLKLVESLVMGLIGKVGFYFSIPALLYLFAIHTFGRKSRVVMRRNCTLLFVFFCGCIAHLTVENGYMAVSWSMIGQLYAGGAQGSTGGLLCGLAAMLIRWFCGETIAFILFILATVLTLLGAMQITVVTLFKAFQNRPRDEEAEESEEVDPATVVVNHLANKKIAYDRQRRQQRLEREQQRAYAEETYRNSASAYAPLEKTAPKDKKRAEALMNQIDSEPTDPVAAAAEHVADESVAKPAPEKEMRAVPAKPVAVEPEEEVFLTPVPAAMPELKRNAEPVSIPPQEPKQEKITAKDTAAAAKQVEQDIRQAQAAEKRPYCFPPIDLLNRPSRGAADGTMEMRENSRRLNETLESFRIDAHIINVTRGPSVTRYEVELDKGVRLNKLTSVADDIALSLGASSVRIAPVPGKISVVGIEVPNRVVTTVSLREVIDSPEFHKSKSMSSFAVGKDIGGSCIIGNIAKMPHMLIAGTTGSGKSVCMNSIILSLLYKAGPEDVKLIMVDPKMVELANYNGIPHLMIPVVTDPKKAAGALQWAVTEMMRRYKTMSDSGVRDLESYNSIVLSEGGEKLPQLVVIIDELADLMLVAAKEVEDSICRIAQMGRAAGIHLVIATQRPSADVITGLMKANIPSRIAFSVASGIESRIILDTTGAEKLVGKGDMLFAPIGSGKPLRVQGCFVSDSEVEAVTSYVKDNYSAQYDQEVLSDIEKKAQQTGKKPAAADPEPNAEELDGDEMLPAAVDVILETGQASVSMLQRRLKLGYARAARIVDEMEEKGIVGPFQGSKPRAILITKEQWESMKGGQPAQMEFEDMDDYGPVPEEIE